MSVETVMGKAVLYRNARMVVAIDILKAVISRDRYTMVSCENKYGRGAAGEDRPIEAISKNLTELALDVLCDEQSLPAETEYAVEKLGGRALETTLKAGTFE